MHTRVRAKALAGVPGLENFAIVFDVEFDNHSHGRAHIAICLTFRMRRKQWPTRGPSPFVGSGTGCLRRGSLIAIKLCFDSLVQSMTG
jgi:hypothetical protein